MNVAIGNDELGVRDNDSNISHDGHIIRNFLRDREFIKLRLGASIVPNVGLSVCRSVCLSVGP